MRAITAAAAACWGTGLAFAWAPGAQAQEVLYRLPYAEGSAFTISQAPGGMMTTHTTRDSRNAIDFSMPEGTPVLAARGGVVVEAEWHHTRGANRGALRSQGNLVRVRHPDGSFGIYGHLQYYGVSVEVHEEVWAGRILGYSGSTGYSSAPHLHFGVTRPEGPEGARVEASVPVTFYNGNPPVAIAPRVGLAVRADYAMPVAPPAPVAAAPSVLEVRWRPEPPPGPTPEMIAQGWIRLAAMIALAAAGLAWFYRFSRG